MQTIPTACQPSISPSHITPKQGYKRHHIGDRRRRDRRWFVGLSYKTGNKAKEVPSPPNTIIAAIDCQCIVESILWIKSFIGNFQCGLHDKYTIPKSPSWINMAIVIAKGLRWPNFDLITLVLTP